MVNNPTVLVLGAGSSMHLNYPLGQKLVQLVIEETNSTNKALYKALIRADYDGSDIQPFRDALRLSGRSSVDAFLEHRPEYISIGKLAIAHELIKREDMNILFSLTNNEHWYPWLYQKLDTGDFESFANNNLSIITFNYDRSLEMYLFTALKNSYGKTDDQVSQVISKISIIHVHGQLANLPWQAKNWRQYTPNFNNSELKTGADLIKIIHENIDSDEEFKKARELLEDAVFIYFLGFGYHETNMDRINISRLSNNASIIGTCFGLTDLEKKLISKRYQKKLTLANSDYNVLKFLRENITLH